MKRINVYASAIGGVALLLLVLISTAGTSSAAEQPSSSPQAATKVTPMDPATQPGTATVQGQVLKIEPDSLILSTGGGGQARLKLDSNAKIEGSPKVGDKVEAQVSSDRNIMSLRISK